MIESAGSQGPFADDLFLDALEIPPSDRAAFLENACDGNEDLREEVESLLNIADTRPDLLTPPDVGLIPEKLGRYEILSECGRGGMGIVFEAKDSQLLRKVALKVLPQFLSRDAKNLGRFTREAQTLAGLNHPNIATLYSLEECSDFHFLTMEFISGVTLAEVLAERQLSLNETLSLGLQVTLALEEAHAIGICHCDLKPANIMVSSEGKISLLDFGIARAFENLIDSSPVDLVFPSNKSHAAGTPDYMAPEQSAGQAVNERTDIWALGAVLFECLTGKRFSPQLAGGNIHWKDILPDKLPPKLLELIELCLERDPSRRLPSVTPLKEGLEGLIEGGSRKFLAWGMAATIVVLALFSLFQVINRGPTGPLDRLEKIGPTSVGGLNEQGELLWTKNFEDPISPQFLLKKSNPVSSDPDFFQVLGCAVVMRPDGGMSTLNFLDPEAGDLAWTHKPAWSVPVNVMGPVQYEWTIPTNWPGYDDPVILTGIRDGHWYSFAIEALDINGDVLGIYHHPGPLRFHRLSKESGIDYEGLVLFGANSSARFNRQLVPFETINHPGCVLRLLPPDFSGQAFPYSENLPEQRDWPDLPKASEKAYLLISMISPDLDSIVSRLQANDTGTGSSGFTAIVEDGRFVILDDDLYPIKCILARDTAAGDLYLSGRASITPFLYMRNGIVEWVDVPVEF